MIDSGPLFMSFDSMYQKRKFLYPFPGYSTHSLRELTDALYGKAIALMRATQRQTLQYNETVTILRLLES